MKTSNLKKTSRSIRLRPVIITIAFMVLSSCLTFETVEQDYLADPNSSFNVHLEVAVDRYEGNEIGSFGICLPIGWIIDEPIKYYNTTTYDSVTIVYDENTVQDFTSTDPPKEGYYWWAGIDSSIGGAAYTAIADISINTDDKLGTFFIDYKLTSNSIGQDNSTDNIVIVGLVQGCAPEGITLSSQEEVELFQNNYYGCNHLAGDLIIDGEDIYDLNSLSILQSIGGSLRIKNCPELTSLSGLQNVIDLGGTVEIEYNNGLENLNGLEGLETIGRDLKIYNYNISSLTGLNHLAIIEKDLVLSGTSIHDMAGLDQLQDIKGTIEIINSNSWVDFSGLEHLDTLSGGIYLWATNLNSFNGLNNLEYLGKSLRVFNNHKMVDFSGLEKLNAIGGNLDLSNNQQHSSFAGFQSLEFIHGAVQFFDLNMNSLSGLERLKMIEGNLEISWSGIIDLAGLDSLQTLAGDLIVTNNYYLENLEGLESISPNSIGSLIITSNNILSSCIASYICNYLSAPNGMVDIRNNSTGCNSIFEVADECGTTVGCLPNGVYYFGSQYEIDQFTSVFPGCTALEGDVIIEGTEINNLAGLSGISSINGNLTINSTSLENLAGLENLEEIQGNLKIDYNPELTSLNGLDGLAILNGHLDITTCWLLTEINALNKLTQIGGDLRIQYCNGLESLSGLENVSSIMGDILMSSVYMPDFSGLSGLSSMGGNLYLHYLHLHNFNGLQGLVEIPGDFTMYDCDAVKDFTGLESLTSIGGDLSLEGLDSLVNMAGLENLETIGKSLVIYNNAQLSSLEELQSLSSIGRDLKIISNNELSNCDAMGICNYLSAPYGTVDIQGNNEGCNSIIQVAEACGTTVGCLPHGNYSLISQHEIDVFPTVFPGCTALEGNVYIQGDDIINLDGLSEISSITGKLIIYNNPSLKELNGLNKLANVGDQIGIELNDSLQHISGLNGLSTAGDNIWIYSNFQLESISGFNDLNTIVGGLIISHGNIDDISGFVNLNTVDADLVLSNMPELTSISGFNYLTSIGGVLSIGANNNLKDIDGFNMLSSIGIDMRIHDMDSLSHISGFQNLETIGRVLRLAGLPELSNSIGLENLRSIDESLIIESTGIVQLTSGLESLESIGRALIILENEELVSLAGALDHPISIGRDLQIQGNSQLSDCEAQTICEYLSNPQGLVEIYGNAAGCNNPPEIAANCGFNMPCLPYGHYYFLTQEEIDNFDDNYPGCHDLMGSVTISGSNITNLDGLIGVHSVDNEFSIQGNPLLENINGLSGLTEAGFLEIMWNPSLQNLYGLENLVTLNQGMAIYFNSSINCIEGIANVEEFNQNLHISENPALSYCAVQSICNLLDSNYQTYVYIYDNSFGCNSIGEVQDACLSVYIEDHSDGKIGNVSLYPNPVFDKLNISNLPEGNEQIILRVYNSSGICLLEEHHATKGLEYRLDFSSYKSGMYFVQVQMGDVVETRKVVKF